MSDPTLQNINPALIPLDWSFYATDSSVIFKLEPNAFQPYWVEAHAHFGRFNSLPLSITLTSHKQGLEDGTALLERILKELLQRRLPAFFSRSGPPAGLELQPSIYYFGIHLQMEAIAFDDPLIKHIPRRARAQVEKVLSVIPPDDLSQIADSFHEPEPETVPPVPSAKVAADIAAIAQPAPQKQAPPAPAPQPAVAPVATAVPIVEPAPATAPAKKRTRKAKTNPAPSPGFTATSAASQPASRVIQPNLVSVAAPASAPATATAVITAPVPVAAGAAWDWEEDDDDIVF